MIVVVDTASEEIIAIVDTVEGMDMTGRLALQIPANMADVPKTQLQYEGGQLVDRGMKPRARTRFEINGNSDLLLFRDMDPEELEDWLDEIIPDNSLPFQRVKRLFKLLCMDLQDRRDTRRPGY
ncbi:MAG: hypothetical protein AAFR07_05570 [Pseudomonadota bacterium]